VPFFLPSKTNVYQPRIIFNPRTAVPNNPPPNRIYAPKQAMTARVKTIRFNDLGQIYSGGNVTDESLTIL
jgi:hypothetical protein